MAETKTVESENINKPIYGICRYNNINGVTCYMNSILHILQQVPIFADYIFNASFGKIIKEKLKDSDEIKKFVCFELYRLFSISMGHDDLTITPNSFRNCIGDKNETWKENRHQDSQEFLTFLISTLEEEIGQKLEFIPGRLIEKKTSISSILADLAWKNYQAKEYSPLKDIFNGMIMINTKCSCCSNISKNFSPFTTLQLSIPIKDSSNDRFKEFSLKECLDFMINEEQLDRDNKYKCDMCGIQNRAYNTNLIWRTPKVLIIQFKRFIVNDYGIRTQKLVNNINYPIYDLDMTDYIDNDSPYKHNSKYNLMGINLHQEFGFFGTNSGHYTSIVKNRMDNNWYLFNDEAKPILATNMDQLQQKNAYLLFYYRTT